MNKLELRTEEEMKDSQWTDEQIQDRLEDQEVRNWMYEE